MEELKGQKVTTSIQKRKKRKKKPVDFSEVDGVHRIILSQETQENIGAVVGKDTTFEKPWIYILKQQLLDHLHVYEDSTEFLALKKEIVEFPGQKMLLGYVVDEDSEHDEFFICTTKEATEAVSKMVKKQQDERNNRLYNIIHKQPKAWTTLGSENDVEEEIPRRNRPLLEVEIETKYPISKHKVKFQFRRSDDAKDGYMELQTEISRENVLAKSRIDVGTQVTPNVAESEAQTTLLYPVNAARQYYYEVETDPIIPEGALYKIETHLEENSIPLEDIFTINYYINFYLKDYNELALKRKSSYIPMKSIKDAIEFKYFLDVEICKNKMISSVAWHPYYTGVVAAAYTDINKSLHMDLFQEDNETIRIVYGINPVLLWSFKNSLKPTLIMETPREVTCLSFCPLVEDLLVGGCAGGQVVLWDLQGRIEQVENEALQVNSRSNVFELIGWKKKIITTSYIRYTAISDLGFSNGSSIVSIKWISPYTEVTKIGNLVDMDEEEKLGLQFITASQDGNICIWDLKRHSQGEDEFVYHSTYLGERPKDLKVTESMYQSCHLRLRPLFQIDVYNQSIKEIPASLTSFYCTEAKLSFTKAYQIESSDPKLCDHVKFTSSLHRTEDKLENFLVGTTKGEFMRIRWESLELDFEDETSSCVVGEIADYALLHDGPITSLEHNPKCNTTLTTGGTIIALWTESLQNKALLWRKENTQVTYGCFNYFQPSVFLTLTADGYVKIWEIYFNSKTADSSLHMSNNALTLLTFQLRQSICTVSSFADAYGCLRLFLNQNFHYNFERNLCDFEAFIKKEVFRKTLYSDWQKKWNDKRKKKLPESKLGGKLRMMVRKDTVSALVIGKLSQVKLRRSHSSKQMDIKHQEIEKVHHDYNINEMVLSKKTMDVEELKKQKRPLQILEEERKKKKQKMRQIQRSSEKMYNDEVAMLFPEIVAKNPPPPMDPYTSQFSLEEKFQCHQNYQQFEKEACDILKSNPFSHVFDRKKVLLQGRKIRDNIFKTRGSHRNRHDSYKKNRDS